MPESTAAQAQAPPPVDVRTERTGEEKLSLQEMSRIMDVASTLRKERDLVDQQLQIDEIKVQLRQRLLEAARVSGDPVTEEEIDAAIDQYYDRLHEFQEPSFGWRVLLAHLWVRRGPLLKLALFAGAVAALFWGLLLAGMLPGERRTRKLVDQEFARVERTVAAIEQLATEPEVKEDAAAMLASANSFREQNQIAQLSELARRLEGLQAELALDYTIRVLSNPGEFSGIKREFGDELGSRTSGYYLLVEAIDSDGRPVQVPIVNRETGRTERVSRWGEQAPQAVFDRLAEDKLSDGALDERTFGRKRRGKLQWEIEMRDDQGRPLARQGQITNWDDNLR